MKLKFSLFALALSFYSLSHAQLVGDNNTFDGYNGLIRTTARVTNANVEGTPYATDEFVVAKISISETEIFKVKYNALLDEFEVQKDNGELYALNKNGRKDITITLLKEKKTYQIFSYIEDNTLQNGFFMHLTNPDAKVNLLLKKNKKFIDQTFATSSYDKDRPAHYKNLNDKFFIKLDDGNAIEVPRKKKDFLKLFPEKKGQIEKFMKTEKLKLKKELDLTKIVNYINMI
ncbi:hypothetical protein [Lacinutrix undariae]